MSTRTQDVVGLEEACGPPAARLWELTPSQIRHSVDAVLPGIRPGQDRLGRAVSTEGRVFSNEARFDSMNPEHIDDVFEWSIELGTLGVESLIERFSCLEESPWENSCLDDMVSAVVSRAYRRPLTETESTELVEFLTEGRADGEESQVTLALCSSR